MGEADTETARATVVRVGLVMVVGATEARPLEEGMEAQVLTGVPGLAVVAMVEHPLGVEVHGAVEELVMVVAEALQDMVEVEAVV